MRERQTSRILFMRNGVLFQRVSPFLFYSFPFLITLACPLVALVCVCVCSLLFSCPGSLILVKMFVIHVLHLALESRRLN